MFSDPASACPTYSGPSVSGSSRILAFAGRLVGWCCRRRRPMGRRGGKREVGRMARWCGRAMEAGPAIATRRSGRCGRSGGGRLCRALVKRRVEGARAGGGSLLGGSVGYGEICDNAQLAYESLRCRRDCGAVRVLWKEHRIPRCDVDFGGQ